MLGSRKVEKDKRLNSSNPFTLKAKSFKGAHYPELEHELLDWIRCMETNHAGLSDNVILEKARAIAERTKVSLKACPHWIQNFKHRHRINVQTLHGEAASADEVSVHIARAMLPELLKGVDPHDIYNMDETGLNYRALPKRTLGSQPRKGCKGPADSVMQELQELLTSFASVLGVHLQTEDLTNDLEERWTEAPQEDVEEDAELATALLQRGPGEDDEEEADDSVERVPMTLKEARAASEALKIFVQENQAEHSELRDYKDAVETLNRLIEKMAFSARSRQTTIPEHFPPASRDPVDA